MLPSYWRVLFSIVRGLGGVRIPLTLSPHVQGPPSQLPWVGPQSPSETLPGFCMPRRLPCSLRPPELGEPQRPFLEALIGHSIGLFPLHTPGRDRNVSSPCPAHTRFPGRL